MDGIDTFTEIYIICDILKLWYRICGILKCSWSQVGEMHLSEFLRNVWFPPCNSRHLSNTNTNTKYKYSWSQVGQMHLSEFLRNVWFPPCNSRHLTTSQRKIQRIMGAYSDQCRWYHHATNDYHRNNNDDHHITVWLLSYLHHHITIKLSQIYGPLWAICS